MKILLVHNYYGSSAPSGENTVFEAERDLLRSKGHEVLEYTTSSDGIRKIGALGALIGGAATPWNPVHLFQLGKIVRSEEPDILHVHNTFPILSPAIYYAAKGTETAVVLTLHNYRTFCAAAIPLRESRPCTECLDFSSTIPAMKYGCYRESRLATLPLAMMISLHRFLKTCDKRIDAFIALTSFQKERVSSAGLSMDRVHIKPHFYPDPPQSLPWSEREDRIVFIGRLGKEKGVQYLFEAWRKWGERVPQLDIIGSGPLEETFYNEVEKIGLKRKITFVGQIPFEEVQRRLARSKMLVLPSVCFEGFPMVILEALSLGVPVAASNLGSMPCIIDDGVNGTLFQPASIEGLLSSVKNLWQNDTELSQMSVNARRKFDEKYTADVNHDKLLEIYREAIKHKMDMRGVDLQI